MNHSPLTYSAFRNTMVATADKIILVRKQHMTRSKHPPHLFEQELDASRMPLPDGGQDDRDAVLVLGLGVRALGHQVGEHLQLAVVGGEVAGPPAVNLSVHVRVLEMKKERFRSLFIQVIK